MYQSKALAHREIPPAPANQPLTTNQIGEFSTYLGVNPLPAVCISAIEQLAVTHRRAVALSLQGHTKNSVSRHLRRLLPQIPSVWTRLLQRLQTQLVALTRKPSRV